MCRQITNCVIIFLLAFAVTAPVNGHELRPAYLEIKQRSDESYDVLWKVPAKGDLRLGLYVRFPDDCKETTERTAWPTGSAFIERWEINCPGGLIGRTITIDGLATMLTDVLVRLESEDGKVQTVRLDALTTSFEVAEAPTLVDVAAAYTWLGIEHILLGIDHLLFVLGLLLIVRRPRMLFATITSFTVAHSISLGLAVFGVVNIAPRPVDAAIALSIVFMGAEILYAERGRRSLTLEHPWLVAFAFGLLHGLGFAGALTALGLPADDIPAALLFFNVGVEIGQLAFVTFFLLLAWSFRVLQMRPPMWTKPLPAYGIGTIAMYWFLGRVALMIGVTT